jgi:hypothetical protein
VLPHKNNVERIKMNLLKMIFLCILFSLLSSQAFSLPRFAVRLSDKCIDCHYNPTGGVIRNENGWQYGKNLLGMISPRDKKFTTTPKIGDNISIGIDYRTQFLYSAEKEKTDFQQMSGSIYTNLAITKKINVLARYDFVNFIWEAYGVAHILPNNGYIKAGSFQPNYGLRLDDHTAYTRGGDLFVLFDGGKSKQGLIYTPWYTEAGMEAGIYISDWAFITASAGSNLSNRTFSKDPTYTTRVEVSPSIGNVGLLFGGSYAAAKIPHTSEFYGIFAGGGYHRFSILAEFDRAKNVISKGLTSNVLMVEAAYVIVLGLEAIVRFDWLDPDINLSKDDLSHVIVGFEWFPYSFIEIRPQYRFTIENPNITNDAAVLQFHFWY